MFKKRTGRDARGATEQPSTSFSEVLIRRDGSAVVDGAPFPVPEGEPVHVAVLDGMHGLAHARGAPVVAVIDDRQEGYAAHLEVAPDGSSRLLVNESPQEQPGAEPPPDGTRVRIPVPAAQPTPAPVPPREPVRELVQEPAREPAPVPVELAEFVGQITHAIDSGASERATALAFRLREHTARTFGPEHPVTLEAHALEAFTAHRSANHRLATTSCLELARMRHRLGDLRAHEELTRAVAAWWLIDDPAFAVEHGRELLAMLSALAERGGSPPQHTDLASGVNHRIRALAAAAAAPRAGAA